MINKNKKALQLSIDRVLWDMLDQVAKNSGYTKSDIIEVLVCKMLQEIRTKDSKHEN